MICFQEMNFPSLQEVKFSFKGQKILNLEVFESFVEPASFSLALLPHFAFLKILRHETWKTLTTFSRSKHIPPHNETS